MLEEIKSIEDNKTWRLENLPAGQRPIGLKWIFKAKKNAQGEIVEHKARLVAKGYVQQQGIDFEEVFAPVACMEMVRLMLSLAAREGFEVHHMDVKSAFLTVSFKKKCMCANRWDLRTRTMPIRCCGSTRLYTD